MRVIGVALDKKDGLQVSREKKGREVIRWGTREP